MDNCVAVNNALGNSGKSHADLASEANLTEQRVKDICSGKEKPTEQEFKRIAKALNMSDVEHTGVHATK